VDDLRERAIVEALPREFLADVALHYCKNGDNNNGYGHIGGCEFHEHGREGRRDCDNRIVGSLVFR
jgi:hypothetical protein